MTFSQRLFAPHLCLSLLFTILLAKRVHSNCQFVVPTCTTVPSDGQIAEYVLRGGKDSSKKICVNSNSSQTEPTKLTLRIHYENGGYGVFCTDTLFNSSSACAFNSSLIDLGMTSLMFFKANNYVGEKGSFALNFTLEGVVKADAYLYYAPTGLYSLDSSTVTTSAGDSFILSWLSFDVTTSLSISAEESGAFVTLSGSLSEGEPWEECLQPDTLDLNRPQLFQYTASSANIEEAGTYTLSADGLFSASVEVIVTPLSGPPQLSVGSNSTLYLQRGSMAVVACDIVGTTRSPAWLLDNVPLFTSSPDLMIKQDGLVFPSVKTNQRGWYTCLATNQWGRTVRDFLVITGITPIINIPPNPPQMSSYGVQPGTRVILPCNTTAIPPPDVKWFANGTEFAAITDPTSDALIIENYTTEQQAQFHCQATNAFGTINSIPFVVTLLPLDSTIPGSMLQASYHISPGESVILPCSNSLSNQYRYSWNKNHLPFQSEMAGSLGVQITVSGSTDGKTSGYYCCEMKSNNSVLLDTRCTIVTVRLAGTLLVQPSNNSIVAGRSVEMFCFANTDNGIDFPHLSWYRGNKKLPDTPADPRLSYVQEMYGFTTLQIRNVNPSDQDVYVCEGVNFVSTVSGSAELRVVESLCMSNVLNSSDAEEDVAVVQSSWNFPADEGGVTVGGVADSNGENVFMLAYQGEAEVPEISQAVSVSTTSQARLTARMRTSVSTLQPMIQLAMTNSMGAINLSVITLPFPSRSSWQWVTSTPIDVSGTEASPATLRVILFFSGTGPLNSAVFFDDICLELVEEPSSSAPTVSSGLNLQLYYVVGGAAVGVALLLILVIFVFCVCCLCRAKSRKRSRKYKTKSIDVPLEKVRKFSAEIDTAHLTSYNQPDAEKNEQDHANFASGETPTYLDVIDGQKEANQSDSRHPMPVANSNTYEPLITSTSELLKSTSASQLQQAEGNTQNPTLYMALVSQSMESQSTYMAPTGKLGHKQPNTSDQVEEVYDMPLLQDHNQVEEMYDIIPDTKQASAPQNGNPSSEENNYYM